jgi:hypothetical protein
MGFSAGDPNPFRFVFNDPTNWVDPTGEVEAPPPPTVPMLSPGPNKPAPTNVPVIAPNGCITEISPPGPWRSLGNGVSVSSGGGVAIIDIPPPTSTPQSTVPPNPQGQQSSWGPWPDPFPTDVDHFYRDYPGPYVVCVRYPVHYGGDYVIFAGGQGACPMYYMLHTPPDPPFIMFGIFTQKNWHWFRQNEIITGVFGPAFDPLPK